MASRAFIQAVLQHTVPAEFRVRLHALNVDAALLKSLDAAKDELQKVLKDKARHLSTYNHYFTTTIQKTRQRKHQKKIQEATKLSKTTVTPAFGVRQVHFDADRLMATMDKAIEPDMDVFSSQEALDSERAYYKDELKYFVNAIAKSVIERHLVEPLPDNILSPLIVTGMTEKEIAFVAAERAEITQQRLNLESKKAMLEKGLETFRKAMGGLNR